MINITHEIPKHQCFGVMLPARGGFTKRCLLANNTKGELYTLKHKNGTQSVCTLLSYWEYKVFEIPDELSLLVYGMQTTTLVPGLTRKYPELTKNPNVEILLLQINPNE